MFKLIRPIADHIGRWWQTPKKYPNGSSFTPAQHVIYFCIAVVFLVCLFASYVFVFTRTSIWTFSVCMLLSAVGWLIMYTTPSAAPKESSGTSD